MNVILLAADTCLVHGYVCKRLLCARRLGVAVRRGKSCRVRSRPCAEAQTARFKLFGGAGRSSPR
eukprot:6194571-Pleurochrysis_carterae.AAC.1